MKVKSDNIHDKKYRDLNVQGEKGVCHSDNVNINKKRKRLS